MSIRSFHSAVVGIALLFGVFVAVSSVLRGQPATAWEEIVWGRATITNESIASAGFTSDGQYVLAASPVSGAPGVTRLFDRVTGLLVWQVPSFHRVVTYNPTANLLAISTYQDKDLVEVWHIGERRRVAMIRGTFNGIYPLSLSLSDNGRYLALSGLDSTVHVWDIDGDRMVRSWKFDSVVSYVNISPKGRYVFGLWGVFGPYAKGWLWDVETGEVTMKMIRHYFSPSPGFAFSPDERYFAMQGTFAGYSEGVSIYAVPDGKPIREFLGVKDGSGQFDYAFRAVAFSPDGALLAGYSDYNRYRSLLWNVETGERIDSVDHSQMSFPIHINAYGLDKDNRSLLMGFSSGHLNTWDFMEHCLVRQFLEWPYQRSSHIMQTFFSGSGKYLVAGYAHGQVRIYNAQTGDTIRTLPHSSRKVWSVNGLDVSSDDSLIAVGGRDSLLTLYHLSSGEPAWVSSNRGGPVWDVKFTPDGRRVAASSDVGIEVFDVLTGDSLLRIPERDTVLFAFSPDGVELASVGRAGQVRVWSSAGGALVRELGVQESPNGIVWSGDGEYIATCGGDGSVRVWDALTGALFRSWRHEEGGKVYAVAFAPDSRHLYSGGQGAPLRVWDVLGNFEVYRYHDFSVPVSTISVSTDGAYVATTGSTGYPDYHLIVRRGVGSFVSVPDESVGSVVLESFSVTPTPSRGDVRISFWLSGTTHVRLRVSDVLGRLLWEPVQGVLDGGRHESVLSVGDLSAGTYFCTLEVDGRTLTRTLVLSK